MSLTLCVVARNEADVIGSCLDSARDAVDEIVVVDTGSGDATPEIARQHGARVHSCPWPGAFDAAYDLPLRHAQGEWVFSLDADEVLDPEGPEALRELTRREDLDGFVFTLRNYTFVPPTKLRLADSTDPLTRGASFFFPSQSVRLFRNRDDIRYSGAIHQSVGPAIRARGGEIGRSGIPIHHHGPLRGARHHGKTARYLDLARAKARGAPRDGRAQVELGVCLQNLGETDEALDAFDKARALGYGPGASFLLGLCRLRGGEPERAIPHLEECLQDNPSDDSIDFDNADALEALGEAWMALERPEEAKRALRGALRLRPGCPVGANSLAALLAEEDSHDEARDLAEDLISRFPGLPEPWTTLGACRLHALDLEGGREAFERALEVSPEYLPARINLGLALELLEEQEASDRVYAAAREVLPADSREGDDLQRRIPAAEVEPAAEGLPHGSDVVVSLVTRVGGGSGRVLADVLRALSHRPNVVVCNDPGVLTGQELREEIEAGGVPVRPVGSEEEALALVAEIAPGVLLHHYWSSAFFPAPRRAGQERWVCIGHGVVPLPEGYDAYVVLSECQRCHQAHLPPDRVRLIPNGVDLERFRLPSRRSSDAITIGMVSRLAPDKFPRRLLAYLPELRELDARVRIAGWGGRRFEIEADIRRAGLEDRVAFVGSVPAADMPTFLSSLDIGLHLNETAEENCPMAVLEMMAAGLPVVSQPRAGIPELVRHEENGLLGSSEAEVAAHLERCIRTAGLRARLGAASRKRAARFDLRRVGRAYRELVDELSS